MAAEIGVKNKKPYYTWKWSASLFYEMFTVTEFFSYKHNISLQLSLKQDIE